MATVLLFHHAQGQTPGFLRFADDLRAAGHTVHAPDLYHGHMFPDLTEGVAYAAAGRFCGDHPPWFGGSQSAACRDRLCGLLARRAAGAGAGADASRGEGALLFHGCVAPSELGTAWPEAVPLQIHIMAADHWTVDDRAAAQALVAENPDRRAVPLPRLGPPVRRPKLRRLRRGGGRPAQGTHARLPGPGWLAPIRGSHGAVQPGVRRCAPVHVGRGFPVARRPGRGRSSARGRDAGRQAGARHRRRGRRDRCAAGRRAPRGRGRGHRRRAAAGRKRPRADRAPGACGPDFFPTGRAGPAALRGCELRCRSSPRTRSCTSRTRPGCTGTFSGC